MKDNRHTFSQGRRGFFEKIGALIIAGTSIEAYSTQTPKDISEERIKMLTQDGMLVEVKRSVYDKTKSKRKIPHKRILNWITRG